MNDNKKITDEFFIKPGFDLSKNDNELNIIVNISKEKLKERWETKKGKDILNKLKENKFDRSVLVKEVGKYYGHFDLRGIPLKGEDLSNRDLSFVDFYSADLEDANLSGCNLEESWLSETNIKGARFDWAKMDKVLLDNVAYNNRTSFIGVNLNAINFTLAALLQDLALNQQRIVHLESKNRILAFFLKITSDYGRSFALFTFWCIAFITLFAIAYILLWPGIGTFWQALYTSLLLFMTAGVDIPQHSSNILRIVVAGEIIVGYLMMGLLIAILVRKTIGS